MIPGDWKRNGNKNKNLNWNQFSGKVDNSLFKHRDQVYTDENRSDRAN